MARWRLEVGKMAMYLLFPVGMFWFFNHPQFFEKYLINAKEKLLSNDEAVDKEFRELEQLAAAIDRQKLEAELLSRKSL